MKPLQLTTQHRERLLEMCKVFYPDLQKLAFDAGVEYYGSKKQAKANYCGFYITGDNCIQCSYPIDSRDDSFHEHLIESTHWFEFCMTHLQNKILVKASQLNKSDDLDYNFYSRLTDSWYESHPIDFLYQEFKKLE